MDRFVRRDVSRVDTEHPPRFIGGSCEALAAPVVISGYVQHGRKLGRALGAPTANIALADCPSPLAGSYAAEITGLDRVYQGCAHLGVCPSVGGTVARLETHLFDFDADIYGALLTVRLLCRVSSEQELDSLAALERKIARDVAACHNFFALRNRNPARGV